MVTRIVLFCLAGLLLAGASLAPATTYGSLCGWGFTLVVVHTVLGDATYRKRLLYLTGVVFHLVSFYWIPYTAEYFGGFPYMLALGIFVLFSLLSALQFPFFGWLFEALHSKTSIRPITCLTIAWLCSEFLFPRMFPWVLSYSQLGWTQFAALAQVFGPYVLSAFMFWWVGALLSLALALRMRLPLLSRFHLTTLGFALVLLFLGQHLVTDTFREVVHSKSLKVAIIQGNLEAREKNDVTRLEANLDRYRALSEKAVRRGAALVIWPEAVVTDWTPEEIASVRGTRVDPYPELTVPLIYGLMSYRKRSAEELRRLADAGLSREDQNRLGFLRFNSMFGLNSAGQVQGVYHKRALMPFGEYMPFGEQFPLLYEISPQTGQMNIGDKLEPIRLQAGGQDVRAGGLICYEDLLPWYSRDAVRRGANLLVNLTNDAWYGDTAAPHQHQLLAAWRAIETRRYLVRSTNTGFTTVVNPLGAIEASLPVFTEGDILQNVRLLESETLYTRLGDIPLQILAYLVLVAALLMPRPTKPTK